MEVVMNNQATQAIRIVVVCLDGISEYIISVNDAKKSCILQNLMEDLGYNCEDATGNECDEVIPLLSGFKHLTCKDADIFVTIWTQHYESIPKYINIVMINTPIVVPDELSDLVRTSQATRDYLTNNKGLQVIPGSELDKWDFILLSKLIAPAIFLNLPEMHYWLEYMVGRLSRHIVK